MSAQPIQANSSSETGIVRTLGEIKRKILEKPGVEVDLNPIVKAGADRDGLLDLLARAVMGEAGLSEADRIRKKQQELRSIAAQVRTVTGHAERVADDPSSYLEFRSPFKDAHFERYTDEETQRRADRWPFQGMRDYADWAEREARNFGELLRRNAQKEGDLCIFSLLSWVYSQTGQLFADHLAPLLTDASEAAGQATNFTPGQISKMFKRHVLPSR